MPSLVQNRPQKLHQSTLDSYEVEDDPFASPSPPSSPKKRKDAPTDSLGLDQTVDVKKRVRAKAPKLDEDRLLSEAGIPELRKRAKHLKLKGKGHEFTDAARLLSFYQLWLDDLFPKARFLDALAMVEKTGHKKRIITARKEWIDESRPRAGGADDNDIADLDVALDANDANKNTTGEAPEPTTGMFGDVPDDDDEDLYGASPRRRVGGDVPDDDDDLDAMMAEAEVHDREGQASRLPRKEAAPEEDELEALMAESEAHSMRQSKAAAPPQPSKSDDGEADLDALIAEAETQPRIQSPAPDRGGARDGQDDFEAEEAAMQEMDGLW